MVGALDPGDKPQLLVIRCATWNVRGFLAPPCPAVHKTYAVVMLGYILSRAVGLYSLIILLWVITSWFPQLRRHEIVRAVGRICEPPLGVARRIIPNTGSIDLSPMLVIVLLQVLAGALLRLPF